MILHAALPAYQATVARHTMSVRTLIRPTDKSVSLKRIINGDRLQRCLQSYTVFCLTLKQLIVPHVEIISLDAYRLIVFLPNFKVRRLKSSGWKHFSVLCYSVIGKIIVLYDDSEDSFPCTSHKSNTKVMIRNLEKSCMENRCAWKKVCI